MRRGVPGGLPGVHEHRSGTPRSRDHRRGRAPVARSTRALRTSSAVLGDALATRAELSARRAQPNGARRARLRRFGHRRPHRSRCRSSRRTHCRRMRGMHHDQWQRVRLHRRRRRFRRLRAREPPVRGSCQPRAPARGRRQGQQPHGQDPPRLREAARQRALRVVLPDRARSGRRATSRCGYAARPSADRAR